MIYAIVMDQTCSSAVNFLKRIVGVNTATKPSREYQYHGEHGQIADILEDKAGSLTGEEQDSLIYQIQLDNRDNIDVRYRAIRPPIE